MLSFLSYDMSKIGFLQDLLHGVSKVLDGDKKPEPVKETVVVQQAGSSNAAALVDRGEIEAADTAALDAVLDALISEK